jgi:uncharacterized membrane protein (DUF4010 family)
MIAQLENEILGVAIAAIGGAAVGVDRQRSYSDEEPGTIGGLRTFALLGTVAGVCGFLIANQFAVVGIVMLASTAAAVLIVRLAAGKIARDATTEIAAMAVMVIGVTAGLGHLSIAAALYAWTVLLLIEKLWLHTLVERIGIIELEAAAQFAAMALIVLPILPAGSFGPRGVFNPRFIWILVLAFSGISFAGYLARKALGSKAGWVATGLIGGLISSTQVTLSFARDSHRYSDAVDPLVGGTMAASSMSMLRVSVVCLLIRPALAAATLPYLIAPFVIGVGLALHSLRRPSEGPASLEEKNPLRILTAIYLALLFASTQYGVTFARIWLGRGGMLGSAALLGSADVDALVASLAPMVRQGMQAAEAAKAIVLGIIGNTMVKFVISIMLGRAGFRWKAALGLASIIIAIALGVFFIP